MTAKLIVAVVVIPFDRGVLDGAVHPLDLATGPRMVGLGQAMLDPIAGVFVRRHPVRTTLASALAGTSPPRRTVHPHRFHQDHTEDRENHRELLRRPAEPPGNRPDDLPFRPAFWSA